LQQPAGQVDDHGRVHRAVEGALESHRCVGADPHAILARPCQDVGRHGFGGGTVHLRIGLRHAVGAVQHHGNVPGAGGRRQLIAFHVRDQGREHRVRHSGQASQDVRCASHGRHCLGGYEGGDLDVPQARVQQGGNQPQALRRLQHARLILQSVARSYVVDDDSLTHQAIAPASRRPSMVSRE
jgi:hypothetical protein